MSREMECETLADNSQGLIAGYPGRMFILITTGLATAKFGRYLLPQLLPAITSDLNLTSFQAGIALSVMTLWFGIVQYPSGRFADQLSRKTVLLVAMCFLFIGFAVVAGASLYAVFLLGTAIIGIGEGLWGPADRALLSDLFVSQRGKAFGTHMMAVDLSGLFAVGLATTVLTVTVWRVAFLPLLVVPVIVITLFHMWSRESIVYAPITIGARDTVVRLFKTGDVRRLIIAYILFMFVVQGFIGFLPTFLQDERGFSLSLASTTFALLFVIGVISKPMSGTLSDRFSRRSVLVMTLILSTAGLIILVSVKSTLLVVSGVAIFALGQRAFPSVMQAYLMDVFPNETMGGDLGAMRTIYIALGSFGPAYVGYVSSVATYTLAFVGLAFCMFISLLIIAWPGIHDAVSHQ